MLSSASAQTYLDHAIDALASAGDDCHAILNALPVPVYTTDVDGSVTFWNRACVDFAGREPRLGDDQWCVTWRLFTTDDEPLPHDCCTMATAIKEQRAIRGQIAIAMRPDGSRRAFTPYPTPLYDADGRMTGAVNLLVDISAAQAPVLASQADRCRRLAESITDRDARIVLRAMAEGYARSAAALAG